VRVSPRRYKTTNQEYGTICSFYCARGYQISGPSSTRCGIVGAWSEDVNTVSCNGLYSEAPFLSYKSQSNTTQSTPTLPWCVALQVSLLA